MNSNQLGMGRRWHVAGAAHSPTERQHPRTSSRTVPGLGLLPGRTSHDCVSQNFRQPGSCERWACQRSRPWNPFVELSVPDLTRTEAVGRSQGQS